MNKIQAANLMNYYGKNRKPFLFLIDFLAQNAIIIEISKLAEFNICVDFPDFKFFNHNKNTRSNHISKFEFLMPDFEQYKKSFELVKSNICYGNSYLVNLTLQTEIITDLTLDDIFFLSKAKYKIFYDNEFTFFSPEIFVKIIDGKIFSFPMKGTIDADLADAEKNILNDTKEIAEHYTIVDLIRNDLNIVANNVSVDKFRYVDYLKTSRKNLLQISSQISGNLSDNFNENIGDIFFSLLPAGSISGAPKNKTLEIIQNAENYEREYYTGVAGIFDGKNVDSCVMIRFIQKKSNKMFYKAGGGITSKSIVENEFNEILNKIYIPI